MKLCILWITVKRVTQQTQSAISLHVCICPSTVPSSVRARARAFASELKNLQLKLIFCFPATFTTQGQTACSHASSEAPHKL